MFGYRLDQAKGMFFDRFAVSSRLWKGRKVVLSRIGGTTRKIAKRSIRPIRKGLMKKIAAKLQELKTAHGEKWKQINSEIRALRYEAHSKRGKPPKSIQGNLKKFILYGYDPKAESVVIGPTLLSGSTGAPERLEFGGPLRVGQKTVYMEPRPYMGPARDMVEPMVADWFRDCMK